MLTLDPSDPNELAYALNKAVRQSGLSQTEVVDRLKQDYDVEITASGLSHVIHHGPMSKSSTLNRRRGAPAATADKIRNRFLYAL